MSFRTSDPADGHARFEIHGRVQGVGFRWWTRLEARRLGLTGTVRNAPDGTVEIVARGDSEALERFAGLLAEGPPMAQVERVLRGPAPPGSSETFEIEH